MITEMQPSRRRPREYRWAIALAASLAAALGWGCRQDMHDQPAHTPLESSEFFADGRSARPPVEGTVARGHLREDDHLYRGLVNGEPSETFPFPVDMAVMQRGRERYDIFCAPCHDRLGEGRGMVVRRGLAGPVSFHEQRLQDASPGYFFDVITRGFGRMMPYASQIPPRDRWAIVAYIRALQHSRRARLADLPEAARKRLERREAQP